MAKFPRFALNNPFPYLAENDFQSAILHKMMLGLPTKLASQFRLTYNMILNLLRVEALKVEDMIKRSFSENATQRLAPDQQKKVTEGERALLSMPSLDDSPRIRDIRKYYDLAGQMASLNTQVVDAALAHPSASKVFATGRIVVLRDGVRSDSSVTNRLTFHVTAFSRYSGNTAQGGSNVYFCQRYGEQRWSFGHNESIHSSRFSDRQCSVR